MASSQDPMPVTPKVEPPLESMSRSFIDFKPDIIKYDVKHTHVVTIGNSTKMEEEHWNMFVWRRRSLRPAFKPSYLQEKMEEDTADSSSIRRYRYRR